MRTGPARHPWMRRGVLVVGLVLVVEYVVLPQLVGARQALDLLTDASTPTLLVALGLEAGSLLSYSALTRSVLPPTDRPRFGTLLRIDLTGLGASHVVPGGGATAAGLRYRLLTHAGVEGQTAVTSTAIQTAAAMTALVAIFASGVALSLQDGSDARLFEIAGAVAVALVAFFAAALAALLLAPERTRTLLGSLTRRLPLIDPEWVDRLVAGFAIQVRAQTEDRRILATTTLWAVGNWLLDVAALWTCLYAFGGSRSIGPLLAVYGVANLLAFLPVTPGGLGIVEGVLVPALVSFGSPHAVALVAVLTWRLVEFWLPVPVAGLTYLSLRLGVLRDRDLAVAAGSPVPALT